MDDLAALPGDSTGRSGHADQEIERRVFTRGGLIKAGAVAALAAGAGGAAASLGAGAGAAVAGMGKPSGGAAYLRHATYVPLVGSEFRVHVPGGSALRMRLTEAQKLRGAEESFSLIFRGRRNAKIDRGGGIYLLEHPSLGGFELFVSPVGRGEQHLALQAIVDRSSI